MNEQRGSVFIPLKPPIKKPPEKKTTANNLIYKILNKFIFHKQKSREADQSDL